MAGAHRHGDARVCGATTDVKLQSTVYVNEKLWAVKGDVNTHGGGGLINSGTTVKIAGYEVIVNSPDSAAADSLCVPIGPPHCAPSTAAASTDVKAYG